MYTCKYMYLYTYIYSDKDYILYICIHIYIHICMYIHIYNDKDCWNLSSTWQFFIGTESGSKIGGPMGTLGK